MRNDNDAAAADSACLDVSATCLLAFEPRQLMARDHENPSRGRVVIIDDERVLRTTFAHLLRKARYSVWSAEDGVEGVNLCRELQPDVVITDLLMPGQDGIATITILRREFPQLPIVAVSAVMGSQNRKRCIELGATHCLHKPVRGTELVAMVHRILEEREPGE